MGYLIRLCNLPCFCMRTNGITSAWMFSFFLFSFYFILFIYFLDDFILGAFFWWSRCNIAIEEIKLFFWWDFLEHIWISLPLWPLVQYWDSGISHYNGLWCSTSICISEVNYINATLWFASTVKQYRYILKCQQY